MGNFTNELRAIFEKGKKKEKLLRFVKIIRNKNRINRVSMKQRKDDHFFHSLEIERLNFFLDLDRH